VRRRSCSTPFGTFASQGNNKDPYIVYVTPGDRESFGSSLQLFLIRLVRHLGLQRSYVGRADS
jgi:hypothetical protein